MPTGDFTYSDRDVNLLLGEATARAERAEAEVRTLTAEVAVLRVLIETWPTNQGEGTG